MDLIIHNFAKIESAEIALNGITLIAGANDTGKSTCGKALCTLLMALEQLESSSKSVRRNKIREAINKIKHFQETEAQRIEQERRQAEEEAERKRIAAEEAKRRQEEYLQNLKDELSDNNKESKNLSDYKIEESVEEAEFEGLD